MKRFGILVAASVATLWVLFLTVVAAQQLIIRAPVSGGGIGAAVAELDQAASDFLDALMGSGTAQAVTGATPTQPGHLTTKSYVDAAIAGKTSAGTPGSPFMASADNDLVTLARLEDRLASGGAGSVAAGTISGNDTTISDEQIQQVVDAFTSGARVFLTCRSDRDNEERAELGYVDREATKFYLSFYPINDALDGMTCRNDGDVTWNNKCYVQAGAATCARGWVIRWE